MDPKSPQLSYMISFRLKGWGLARIAGKAAKYEKHEGSLAYHP